MPRWQDFGVAGATETRADVWRPIDDIGRIRTVERAAAPESPARSGAIEARFLQDSAATGVEIGIEVSIPAALSEDLRVELRLVPGEGDNPAVAGEDFVDEPIEVTIVRGETTAEASVRLLHNAELRTPRTLAVEVSLAS